LSLGVSRETVNVDGWLEVDGLVWRDEPPLLATSDLTETVEVTKIISVAVGYI
jgi:hypothetical protein